MAISLPIYSNGNARSKTINVEFVADYLASISSSNGVSNSTRFFFKFNTNARNTDNETIKVKISESLSDLALNKTKQRVTDTSNNYSNIKTMIIDYAYDMINGHDANLYSSGAKEQKPMKFN